MAARIFKGRKIECDFIDLPYLSGVVGKPEALQTNIICNGGSPWRLERLVFDGDCEEEFYEWAEKNGLARMQKCGDVFFTDNPIAYMPDVQSDEIKIVSGGQTGVDRGGLQAAMDMGLAWGGWAPKGWRSEDGTIPPSYRANMLEHTSANYLGRTRRNVVDSHATLIVTNAYPLSGGTLKTRLFCEEMMRSHFVVSLDEADAVGKVQRWLAQFFAQEHPVPFVLNVSGPRESKAGGIQKRTREFLTEVLQGMM